MVATTNKTKEEIKGWMKGEKTSQPAYRYEFENEMWWVLVVGHSEHVMFLKGGKVYR
jgi:hypothetical protein